jgi:hypothetical protein
MRRPTKELLDAVGRDGRPLRGTIVAKREVAAEWKPSSAMDGADDGNAPGVEEPPSPLGAKTAAAARSMAEDEPAEATTVCESVARTAGNRRAPAGAATVKPLLKVPRPAKSAPLAEARLPATLRDEDMAIFDFTESSPSSEIRVDAPRPGSSAASSRRRSTISEEKDGAPVRGGGRNSIGARRRSMMV